MAWHIWMEWRCLERIVDRDAIARCRIFRVSPTFCWIPFSWLTANSWLSAGILPVNWRFFWSFWDKYNRAVEILWGSFRASIGNWQIFVSRSHIISYILSPPSSTLSLINIFWMVALDCNLRHSADSKYLIRSKCIEYVLTFLFIPLKSDINE